MSHNTFGHLFRMTTWGESHGPAIGCIVDGCPPGIPLTAEEIQVDLNRRKPGQSRYTTQRREADAVEILSGVFADGDGPTVTTGTPISLLIRNTDRSGARRSSSRPPPTVRFDDVSRITKGSPAAAAIGRSRTSCAKSHAPGAIGSSPRTTTRPGTSAAA